MLFGQDSSFLRPLEWSFAGILLLQNRVKIGKNATRGGGNGQKGVVFRDFLRSDAVALADRWRYRLPGGFSWSGAGGAVGSVRGKWVFFL